MTVYAITDTKKGELGLRLLIFKVPHICFCRRQQLNFEHSLLDIFTVFGHWSQKLVTITISVI